MSATVGSDKLPMCTLIPRATIKKALQRKHILESNADVSQLNYFLVFKTPQRRRGNGDEKQREHTQDKQ